MPNIVLTRIDDRLIHGQVMTAWVKCKQANRIIIVDDNIAQDEFMQKVLKMAAPPGIKVEVYDVQRAIKVLREDSTNDNIIILAKYPATIFSLLEGGVKISELNVGGMGASPGRKLLYKNISVSEEEKEIFKKILEKGVPITIKIVPDEKGVEMKKFLR